MAWTEFTRPVSERSGGRYASDATDAEWALVAPLMPRVWTGRGQTGRGLDKSGDPGRPIWRGIRRDPRQRDDRLPVAHGAERLPPGFNGAALFLRLARERASGCGDAPPRGIGASGRRPQASGVRPHGRPFGGCDRQPKRENP